MSNAKPTMETYIEMSPRVFEENLTRADALVGGLVERYARRGLRDLRFVASGSSYNSCVAARPFAERVLGVRVDVFTPSRYLDELERLDVMASDAFEVFVSQSGCSTNIIEAVRAARSRGHETVALTGNVEADLRDEVDAIFEYGVGNETVGFVTMGVLTLMEFIALFSLATAEALGAIDGDGRSAWMGRLSEVPDMHREMQRRAHALMDADREAFLAPGHAFMCGAGAAYGIALEGALKWQETLKAPAIALEPEEYIHGPNMQLTPRSTALFLDPSLAPGRTHEIYRATRAVTDHAYLLACYGIEDGDANAICLGRDVEPEVAPFVLLPAVQVFVGRAMRELGCEPCHPLFDRFERVVSCKTADYEEICKEKLAQAGFAE